MSLPAVGIGQRYRILIIDDTMNAVRPLLSELSNAGFECHYAPGGIPGLGAFKENDPHLVLLDLNMPNMHGGEVCARIRETSEVPIIMLMEDSSSALPTPTIRANEFASKSLPAEELLRRVERLLECVYKDTIEGDEDTARIVKHTPPGWATCEACKYMGPRQKFEVMRYGEPHLACPHCQRDDSLVLSVA